MELMQMDVGTVSQQHVSEEKSERLEYLMKRFGDKVLKLAYYHVKDRYQAEDIAQEVFCRVYSNLDSFREESSYHTWIYRITVNLCRDYLKSAAFRRLLPWGNSGELPLRDTTAERAFQAIEGESVFQRVMDLPVKYRIVLVLYYFEELSTEEIAGILNLRKSTVRTQLCRARKMLKDLLSEEEGLYE
jgi:RNA polymerase sigma-70 factor (ECF subfamily)